MVYRAVRHNRDWNLAAQLTQGLHWPHKTPELSRFLFVFVLGPADDPAVTTDFVNLFRV
jgi:hypothetical protein